MVDLLQYTQQKDIYPSNIHIITQKEFNDAFALYNPIIKEKGYIMLFYVKKRDSITENNIDNYTILPPNDIDLVLLRQLWSIYHYNEYDKEFTLNIDELITKIGHKTNKKSKIPHILKQLEYYTHLLGKIKRKYYNVLDYKYNPNTHIITFTNTVYFYGLTMTLKSKLQKINDNKRKKIGILNRGFIPFNYKNAKSREFDTIEYCLQIIIEGRKNPHVKVGNIIKRNTLLFMSINGNKNDYTTLKRFWKTVFTELQKIQPNKNIPSPETKFYLNDFEQVINF